VVVVVVVVVVVGLAVLTTSIDTRLVDEADEKT